MTQETNNLVVKDKIEGLSDKFTQDEWNSIERDFNPFELKVLKCLKKLGASWNPEKEEDDDDLGIKYGILGDDLYIANRDLLIKPLQLVFPIVQAAAAVANSAKKVKPKVIPAKEKIIFENSKLRAKTHIETVLKTFSGDFQPKYAFNSDIIEIKGIGLLYAGQYLYTNNLQFRKKKHLPFVFTVMVSIERFINNCRNFEGKNLLGKSDIVSGTLLDDLRVWLDKLKTIYTYNGFAIYDHAPELLVFTDYDKAIPRAEIKPRRHQEELMEKINSNFDDGFLLAYNPPMSSGKTTSIGAICSYVSGCIRPKNEKFQLIFACNLPPVRDHAASLCYNDQILFGIGSWCDTVGGDNTGAAMAALSGGKYKIVNHFSCKKDEDRVIIITSPEIAYEILKDDKNGTNSENYLLFLDEPTVGADNIGSETLRTNMSVLSVAPKRTILSSATFPDMNLIPDITNYFVQKYSSAIKLDTVYSNEIQIGCDIKTFEFDFVVPHSGIKTAAQLRETIDVVSKNPFLMRVYTSDVVRSLWGTMNGAGIVGVPNIVEIFQNVDNMSSNKVREIAMEMLVLLARQTDAVVEAVCASNVFVEQVVLNGIEQGKAVASAAAADDNLWDDAEPEGADNALDFTKLATTQAWIMQNTTLIATTDPMKFAETNFYGFVKDEVYPCPIGMSGDKVLYYKSTGNVLKMFENEMTDRGLEKDAFQKSLDRGALKAKTSSGDKKQMDKERDRVKGMTRDDISKKAQEFDDATGEILFPPHGHINSVDHIKRYAGKNACRLYGRNIRDPMVLKAIKYDKCNVSDEVMTLLFAGVGIYSTIDKTICPNYLKVVLEMASSGLLAYIISDVSICYGTNYPINRIIVTDEFAENHSINTLFQLFGRAGRVGRSWIAVVYVSRGVARKLIDYVQSDSRVVVEAENMQNTFNSYLTKTSCAENAFLNYIIAKYVIGVAAEEVEPPRDARITVKRGGRDFAAIVAANATAAAPVAARVEEQPPQPPQYQQRPRYHERGYGDRGRREQTQYCPKTGEPTFYVQSAERPANPETKTWRRKDDEFVPNAPRKQNDGGWRRKY